MTYLLYIVSQVLSKYFSVPLSPGMKIPFNLLITIFSGLSIMLITKLMFKSDFLINE